ncbi:hypothetical protein IMY05_008G0029900 [Salix suchowensis]|nr:hypothetical protein IMY05_008G0029900 [Salix suchowensis]
MLPFCVFFLGMIEISNGFLTKVETEHENQEQKRGVSGGRCYFCFVVVLRILESKMQVTRSQTQINKRVA